ALCAALDSCSATFRSCDRIAYLFFLGKSRHLCARKFGIKTGLVRVEENLPGAKSSNLRHELVIAPHAYFRTLLNLWRRHERKIPPAKRAVDEWLLARSGHPHHLVLDATEGKSDVKPRYGQVLQNR